MPICIFALPYDILKKTKERSDFYAGIGKMSKSVQLNLADALKAVPAGSYTATIYAQESFGKESAPITCPVTVS